MAKRKLNRYQQCVGDKMRGRHFKNKAASKKAFKKATGVCSRKYGAKKGGRRSKSRRR